MTIVPESARKSWASGPLRAGLYKNEIRELSRASGLPNWDLPSACLASRFPYGITLTPERPSLVYEAEKLIYGYGFGQARVRYHGDIARIEVRQKILLNSSAIAPKLWSD